MAEITLVKCSNCGKQIETLNESEVSCRYCGKKTVVEEEEEATDYMRRAQIFNLEDEIRRESYIRNLVYTEAGITFAGGLFLALFVTKNIPLMVVFFVLFIGCILIGYRHHSKLEKLKSMKFDLAGGKLLSEY